MEMNGVTPERENGGNNVGEVTVVKLRGHWTREEDDKLRMLVAEYGPQNWKMIAEKLPGRSSKSCRLRWINQLNPTIRKEAFTETENEKLLAAHELLGNKWAQIAKQFPGRTDNTVKNQWHILKARRMRIEEGRGEKRLRLMNGGYKRSRTLNMSVGSSSSSANSGVTGNSKETDSVNTDLCIGSRVFPVRDDALFKEGRGLLLSTGTEHCTTDCTTLNSMFENMAAQSHPYRERGVNVPFIDFMGVGSV